MSRARRSQSKGSLVESGSAVVQTLIKQPVKEAVREAFAEERASESVRREAERGRERDRTEGTPGDGGSSTDGGKGFTFGRLLLFAALAGAAYYAKQQRGMEIGGDLTEEVGAGRTETGSRSVEDPLSAEGEESTGEESTERTDEGPTTHS